MAALNGSVYAAELHIGYVNIDYLLRDSAIAQKAGKKLEKEFTVREQELNKKIKHARDLQSALEKDSLTLSETERAKRQRELAAQGRELENDKRAFREDLGQRRNEELGAFQERARKAILEIAEREKFDIIFENAVYASPKVDITPRVIKALDR
ncbi:MAG: OmpH family outer membrane protein [Betaproteobacteria bacterium]|nr:MAG: OmpH family outer membrane protein [Betaproteobacteria bacterium]